MITYVYYVSCILTYVNYICCRHIFIICSNYFVEPGSDKSGLVWIRIVLCWWACGPCGRSCAQMCPLAGGHPIGSASVYADAVDDSSLEAGGSRGLSCRCCRASLSNLILTSLILMPMAAFQYCCETRLHKAGLDFEHGMPATYKTLVALNSTSNHNAMYIYVCICFFLYIWDHLSCLMKWLAKGPRFWSCDKSKQKWVQVGIVRNLESIATDSELSQWLSNRVPALLFSGFLPHISS